MEDDRNGYSVMKWGKKGKKQREERRVWYNWKKIGQGNLSKRKVRCVYILNLEPPAAGLFWEKGKEKGGIQCRVTRNYITWTIQEKSGANDNKVFWVYPSVLFHLYLSQVSLLGVADEKRRHRKRRVGGGEFILYFLVYIK